MTESNVPWRAILRRHVDIPKAAMQQTNLSGSYFFYSCYLLCILRQIAITHNSHFGPRLQSTITRACAQASKQANKQTSKHAMHLILNTSVFWSAPLILSQAMMSCSPWLRHNPSRGVKKYHNNAVEGHSISALRTCSDLDLSHFASDFWMPSRPLHWS